MAFDPYHKWLGIPEDEQPPNHYRLLSVPQFESDADVIEGATEQRTIYLRTFQTGPDSELAERLLNEVAAARVCLLRPESKAEYDDSLRDAVTEAAPPPDVFSAEFELPTPVVTPERHYRKKTRPNSLLVPIVVGVVLLIPLVVALWWFIGRGGSDEVVQSKTPSTQQTPDIIAAKKVAATKAAADKLAAERVATNAAVDKRAADKLAAEAAARELAAEKAEAEKAAMKKAATDKLAAEAAARKLATEQAAMEKAAAEKASALKTVGTATKESEAAVAMALQWLAEHQNPNGSWSFDHTLGACQGRCSDKGSYGNTVNGATAMAILPFLGAGQTHKEGKYKENVQAGLVFLMSKMKANGDLTEPTGTMYSHGLCAMALCEAYAKTQDNKLKDSAQASLNYIVYAQDPAGGGWRYKPKTPGDTSVTGWQLTALQMGYEAKLKFPFITTQKAYKFLDSVQTDGGATYGYTKPSSGNSTSAAGLLGRIYLGWKKDEPALQRGVERLSKFGPSSNDMYYNYYASQVMRQYGGPQWEKWNVKMRNSLVAKQSKQGHMKGSWFIGGKFGTNGGRLYNTSMATMILEVYGRKAIHGK